MSEEPTGEVEATKEDEPAKKRSMGQWVVFLLGVTVVIAGVLYVAGFYLPREYRAETSIYLDRPPQVAFKKINSMKAWQEWCPWNEETMPGIKNEYSGPDSGMDSTWTWEHEEGNGKQWITLSEKNLEVEIVTQFEGFKPMTSVIGFAQEGNGTRITWVSKGRLADGSGYGWMALMLPSKLSAEFDKGLRKLVEIVEEEQPPGGKYPKIESSGGPVGGPGGGPGGPGGGPGGPGGGPGGPGGGRPEGDRPSRPAVDDSDDTSNADEGSGDDAEGGTSDQNDASSGETGGSESTESTEGESNSSDADNR